MHVCLLGVDNLGIVGEGPCVWLPLYCVCVLLCEQCSIARLFAAVRETASATVGVLDDTGS